MTQAASSVRTDSPENPACTISSDEPVERPGATDAAERRRSAGAQQLHQTRKSPRPSSEPQQEARHVAPCARRADRS